MTKWADYGIAKVRYNAERTHITKVEVREDKGDTLGSPEEWTRSQVVQAIERGKTFVTILQASGKWSKGRDVHIITVNGVKYLRTDQNRKESDNLENLPEF
ncbi:MAG: DUF3892 domain-containing protein [Chloroflexi bacterium]|nr:DUF3892 domain-containing protein [Chloroflexota bacterium]